MSDMGEEPWSAQMKKLSDLHVENYRLRDELAQTKAALESAEKDVKRYQALATDAIRVQRNLDGSWIARDMAGDPFDKDSFHLGHSLTEVIDAALSAKGSS